MLRRKVAAVQARNRHLEGQLKRERAMLARATQQLLELQQAKRPTASNSSVAPSANPIGAKPPVTKEPTGRKRGAQLGHKGKSRTLLPVEQVDQVIEHRPAVCTHCQGAIAPDAPGQVVGRHQVAELPKAAVLVQEHQSLACRCADCGAVTRGVIPTEIAISNTGARLTAAIAILCAAVKGSKRDVAMLLSDVLSSPIALGSVCGREREVGDALAGVYQDLAERAAGSSVKYVDETSWKLAGKEVWLWVSADADQVIYRIHRWRSRQALKDLFGSNKACGVFCTDRFSAYAKIKRRGLCWAHLKRDFVAAVERGDDGGVGDGGGGGGGAGEAVGMKLLEVLRQVFELWHRFKDNQISRRALIEAIRPLQTRMREALQEGTACGQKKTAAMCRHLLKHERAMWRFTSTPGLEPTNNLAERMLRGAVIWRKRCFGNASESGLRYVERTLSVMQTLRQRGHDNVLDYLTDAITAHRKDQPPPPIPQRVKTNQPKASIPSDPEKLRKVA
jgi:transposase